MSDPYQAERERIGEIQRSELQHLEVQRLLSACEQYGRPRKRATRVLGFGYTVDREDPESMLLISEREGGNDAWPEGNLEFCENWIRRCWEPAARVLHANHLARRVQSFQPGRLKAPDHEIELWKVIHDLFTRLLKFPDPDIERESLAKELAAERERAGEFRYTVGCYFQHLAGFVAREKSAAGFIKPCHEKAWRALEWCAEERPGLFLEGTDLDSVRLTREMHAAIAADCPEYAGTECPQFPTLKVYIRHARRAELGKRSSPRAAREHGPSVVSAEDI